MSEFCNEGIPFEEEKVILYTIVSKNVMTEEVNKSVRTAEKLGEDQYKRFQHDVFNVGRTSIHSVMKRNKLVFFDQKNIAVTSKRKKLV